MKGKLVIVPTPIGNLGDVSKRVIETLSSVDLIAAEDTRRTIQLLNYFEIKKPMTSYHEHNKVTSGIKLIEKILDGKSIALVSDAGMPGISDPGADLVQEAIKNQIEIDVLPGPTAFVNALVLSGLDTREFHFAGFLERNKKKRQDQLQKLESLDCTLIFYEAPHRIKPMLKDLYKVLGNRQVAVARELTKKFEEVLRGSLEEIVQLFEEKEIRGEFVVVVSGNDQEIIEDDGLTAEEWLIQKTQEGMSKKEAIKWVADKKKIPKKEVYSLAIKLFDEEK